VFNIYRIAMSPREKAKKVVGVAGMPGAGKSLAVKIAKERGYAVIVMGDEVREEARRRGVEATPENMGKIMLELREKEGAEAVAKRCLPKIERAEQAMVLVEGIRSLEEVEAFRRKLGNFHLIAIHASPETRFKRLFHRARSDDPESRKTFVERDMRELAVGLGKVIALADYMIVNEGTTREAEEKIRQILREIEKDE